MFFQRSLRACAWIAAFFASGAAVEGPLAAVLRVPEEYATIQGAIAETVAGDKVLVAPGTYVETIDFLGKAIQVVAKDGPKVTIIDGDRLGTVVTFENGEGPTSVISGFTLRHGSGYGRGGGIHIQGASPTVEKNIIADNVTDYGGAGITVFEGDPVIERNVIRNNRQEGTFGGPGGGGILVFTGSPKIMWNVITRNENSVNGAGIALMGDTPTILGNRITDNVLWGGSTSEGGGIFIRSRRPMIVQNLIARNLAAKGGGIFWIVPSREPGPVLINNTIADNDAPLGSAVFADGSDAGTELVNNMLIGKNGQTALYCGDFNDLNPPVISHNNVFSPGGEAYGGLCADSTGLSGNLSVDPGFRRGSPSRYRLGARSPAIDAGDSGVELPSQDYYGRPRIMDGDRDGAADVDLGYAEFR